MDTTTVDVTLRVAGIDLDSDTTTEVLATRFPLMLWEEHGDLVTMTMSVDVADPIAEVVETVRKMEAAIPGMEVLGVHRDFVNATDVALRVDLSREAVRKWTTRDDFPAPHDVVGGDSMKIWAWTQVVAWLQDVRRIEMGESLLSLEQMTQLENCLMRNPDHTTVQWHTVAKQKGDFIFDVTDRVRPSVVLDATGRGQAGTNQPRPGLVAASVLAS